jgi:hypothetical protein
VKYEKREASGEERRMGERGISMVEFESVSLLFMSEFLKDRKV